MSMHADRTDAARAWPLAATSPPPARFVALVIGRDARDADARTAALDALGGIVGAEWAIDADLSDLSDHSGRPVLLLDLTGEHDVSPELLARIDHTAAVRDWPLVVAFPLALLDLVAATCTASAPQLLCDPEVAEWIAALAIAAEYNAPAPLSERVNESEAARLQRLNAEVARIAEVVARLSRQSEATRQRQHEQRRQPLTPPTAFDISAAQIREVIRARRLRDRFFEGGLFEDPAWDMLLDLLAAQLERGQVSVSSLCIAAAVPPTTALRWITKLTDAGLLEREADPFDKRRAFLKLTPRAEHAMQRYVAAVREAKLPFV
jgi:DNA-binding transcriptional ArsR family regulator